MPLNKQLQLASRIVHAETLSDLRREQAKQAGFGSTVRPSDYFKKYSAITHIPRVSP